MMYSPLGRSGIELSRIGLGTVQFGMDYGFTKAKTQEEADEILEACAKNGVNFLDTARDYGPSEEMIGRFLKSRRHGFVVCTKIGQIAPETADSGRKLHEHMLDSVDVSLKALGVAEVPMLCLHQTDSFVLDAPPFWKGVEALRKKEFIHAFGVSVYEPAVARRLLEKHGDVIDFFQVPYSIFDRRFEHLFPRCVEKGIGVIARSVFLKGVIPAPKEKVPGELSPLLAYKEKLSELSWETGISTTDLALLFALKNPLLSSCVLSASTPGEIGRDVKALDELKLLKLPDDRWEILKVNDESLLDSRKWAPL